MFSTNTVDLNRIQPLTNYLNPYNYKQEKTCKSFWITSKCLTLSALISPQLFFDPLTSHHPNQLMSSPAAAPPPAAAPLPTSAAACH